MNESDTDFKTKFMEMVDKVKGDAGKTSSLMRIEKRDRIIRCLQNPQLEPDSKFRSRVKERKYRLLQDGEEIFLGVPDESSGELVYRRAACLEQFWDIINTAHVQNGHIGVVHTFAAIRRIYSLLPRFLVSKYIHMCPVCAHTASINRTPKGRKRKASGESGSIIKHRDSDDLDDSHDANNSATENGAPSNGTSETREPKTDAKIEVGKGATSVAVTNAEDGQTTVIAVQTCDTAADSDTQNDSLIVEMPAGSTSSTNVAESLPSDVKVVFTCHICDQHFEKKLYYQRHIRTHSEHNPAIPFVTPYKPPNTRHRIKQERRSYGNVLNRQVIIDGDMGIEASQGLMLAACRSDLNIVAVTCVSGVVSIESACSNALRTVRACGREDIPVYCGSGRPLIAKPSQQQVGLNGHFWQSQVDTSQIKSEHAVSAMIRLVNENPGRISLVCLGPLTNLALAIRLDPQWSKKLKDIFILGGNTEGRGDSSVCAEQNFHYDPEAAFAVLDEIPNITMLPHEVCERHKLSGDFFDSWVHLGTEKSECIRQMGNGAWLHERQKNGHVPSGCYAVAIIADRTVALEKKTVYATVELTGVLARGMMVVDWGRKLGCELNVDLVRSLDLGKIQSFLNSMVEEPEAMEVYTT